MSYKLVPIFTSTIWESKKKSLQLIWMGTFSVMQEHIFSLNGLMKEQGDTDCELKFIELN
jgi:hypothetical protein